MFRDPHGGENGLLNRKTVKVLVVASSLRSRFGVKPLRHGLHNAIGCRLAWCQDLLLAWVTVGLGALQQAMVSPWVGYNSGSQSKWHADTYLAVCLSSVAYNANTYGLETRNLPA